MHPREHPAGGIEMLDGRLDNQRRRIAGGSRRRKQPGDHDKQQPRSQKAARSLARQCPRSGDE
jgi:hypothetical protein